MSEFPPIGGGIPENPFKLPSDDKIFRMREEEKKRKESEKEASRDLKVWQKSKSESMSRSGRLQELIGETRTLKLSDVAKGTDPEGAKLVAPPRRQEKENMTEFITKKREMFLVQMSLDTKREEIRKLEEKAQMKEEALQRSEQMLEEDAMRFDAFLKENDKKAHDAIKRADEETKRKQEKTSEIKRLTQQIQALSSEMSKHRESLEDCMRYKKFLDMSAPPEWFESHHKAFLALVEKTRKEQHTVKVKEWEKQKRRIQEQHVKDQQAKKDSKRDRQRRGGGGEEEEGEGEEPEVKVVIPPAPRLEDEVVDLQEEEAPMYFTEPKQLMDIFSSLEEQNLFLIQNSQETEHTLEELRHAFKETKVMMDSRTGQLQAQIDELQMLIAAEEARAKALALKWEQAAEMTTAVEKEVTGQQEKEKMLHELNTKVRAVYEQCGFDASSKPGTLFMLSQLESRLEMLLAEIERMPADYVIKAEKEKEKKRREKKREEQLATQIQQQEERNRKAIERSMQAPKKRTGRQVMQRSRPVRKEKTSNVNEVDDGADNDEMRFLTE